MRKTAEISIIAFSWFAALIVLSTFAGLIAYLLYRGHTSLNLSLIFGSVHPLDALLLKKQVFNGLFSAIIGTLALILGSVLLAIPIGICGGIYMAEYCSSKLRPYLNLGFDILSGIPSIVVGLAGLMLTIFLNRLFPGRIAPCLLISCLSLALLVLPYLVRTTQTALETVSPLLRKTAPALGADKFQNIRHVLLPNALPEIVSGIILATGRCAEDTAVIMLTGVVATAGLPKSLFSQYEALPFYIYYISSQYMDAEELSGGFGAAIILLIVCIILLMAALTLQKRFSKKLAI